MPCPSDLRAIARAMGGEVVGGQVLAPGPGHSPQDRSLSIRLSATAPEGFLAFSHAGDDFAACRDHVKRALGVDADEWKRHEPQRRRPRPTPPVGNDDRTGPALALWRQGVDPRGTLVERYLASRGLELGDDIAGEVLRWHPGIRAMLALFRDIRIGRTARHLPNLPGPGRAQDRTQIPRTRRRLRHQIGRRRRSHAGAARRRGRRDVPGRATTRPAPNLGARLSRRSRGFPDSEQDRMSHAPRRALRGQRPRGRTVRSPLA